MGTVILIRHARSVANAENVLAGQLPGVKLDSEGMQQSKKLASQLGEIPIAKVFVSPLERCLQTITPWLQAHGREVPVHSDPRIIEPDYGLWSGRKLEELALEKLWEEVQNNPAQVHFPQGERFVDVWDRVGSFYHSLSEIASGDSNYLVISHGDIIKFLVSRILNLEFSNFQKLMVEPGSITVAKFHERNAKLVQFNRSDSELTSLLASGAKSTLGGEQQSTQNRKD